mmetsp:Transcript_19010/g.44344  ORF Transcript_19010/g.44344 Transcript_19010/m.44344 type:complete len:585 (-) Transcript_19010:72-1826(-)
MPSNAPASPSQPPNKKAVHDVGLKPRGAGELAMLTWNVAGVNNNPFEYWVTAEDEAPTYVQLMKRLESILVMPEAYGDPPQDMDVPIDKVFSQAMWEELRGRMSKEGWQCVDEVDSAWKSDFHKRKIISEFLLDKGLGKKRLTSMPDRVTNTVHLVPATASAPATAAAEADDSAPSAEAPSGSGAGASKPEPACRPTVINNYDGDLSTLSTWWVAWLRFMFDAQLTIKVKGSVVQKRPCEMLDCIKRSKYPDLTEAEEQMSIPLQTLCLAIYDAILVHLMNTISPDGAWQEVKKLLLERLYRGKHDRSREIISSYSHVEVICLQETSGVFGEYLMSSALDSSHFIMVPFRVDSRRDQNSLVLLSRKAFSEPREVTTEILSRFSGSGGVTDGDLMAVSARHTSSGQVVCIVSFHADTNGLMTVPMLEAIHACRSDPTSELCSQRFIMGLDANVYWEPSTPDHQSLSTLTDWLADHRLTSCWGDSPATEPCQTTCHARTFLQPQFQKALKFQDRITKSDRNPKDWIVFYSDEFCLKQQALKDNTGRMVFEEDKLLPTLTFPSDHGLVATVLALINEGKKVGVDARM